MRTITLFLLLLNFLGGSIIAQNQEVMQRFNRPTIANILIRYGEQDKFEDEMVEALGYIDQNPKYNIADIGFDGLTTTTQRAAAYSGLGEGYSKSITNKLRRFVADDAEFFEPVDPFGLALATQLQNEFNVGGLIMKEWATKDSDGNYTVILERSQENLSSGDLKSRTDATKVENFESLLRNNFVIVYDIYRSEDGAGASGRIRLGGDAGEAIEEKVSAIIHAYIYKVDISDELFDASIAPNFDDQRKIAKEKYPLKYVGHVAARQSFMPSTEYRTMMMIGNIQRKGLFKGLMGTDTEDVAEPAMLDEDTQGHQSGVQWEGLPQTQKDTFIFNTLARTSFEDVIKVAEMNVDEFKVRTPITSNLPISAPIGIREGVVADQRYRVYENKIVDGEVVTESVGIVRATNEVTDNSKSRFDENGTELVSHFKQVSGDPVNADMYMVQENDYGLSISIGPRIGYFKFDGIPRMVWGVRSGFNISRTANRILGKNSIYGLYGHVGLGLGTRNYEPLNGNVNNFSIDFGVSKQLYMHRKFDIVPELGFTIVSFGVSSKEETSFSEEGYLFMNLGCRFPVRIMEMFAIEPALEIPLKLSKNTGENPASFLQFAIRGRIDF